MSNHESELKCTFPDIDQPAPRTSCRELECILLKPEVFHGVSDVDCIFYDNSEAVSPSPDQTSPSTSQNA